MPRRLTRPDRRLQPDDAVDRRGTHDRSVGLGPHGNGAQIRGDRDGRAGTRARRRAIGRIRVAALAAPTAPTAQRVRGAKIGPFAKIALAQNHGARGAQPLDQRRVLGGIPALQGERTRRRHHVIRSLDIVLDQDGHAVQRTAGTACFAFRVERGSDFERAGIRFDHRAQIRARAGPACRCDPDSSV